MDDWQAALPPGAHILDLMSSWRSHLPPAVMSSKRAVERRPRPNPAGRRTWLTAHDPLYALIGRKS